MSRSQTHRTTQRALRRRARRRDIETTATATKGDRGAEPEGRRPAGTRPQADRSPPEGGAAREGMEWLDAPERGRLDPQEADVSGGHISMQAEHRARREQADHKARRDRSPRLPILPGGYEDRSSVPRDDRWRRKLRKDQPAQGMVNRSYPPVRPRAAKGIEPWSTVIDTRDDFVAAELDRLGLPYTEYDGNTPAWSSPGHPPAPTSSPDGSYYAHEDSFIDAVVLPGVKPDRNLGAPKKRWRRGWSATRLPPESRTWAEGWDRREYCPIDPSQDASPGASIRGRPRHKKGWRNVGGIDTERYRTEHDARRHLVRRLRPAGYVAREYSRTFVAYENIAGRLSEYWMYTDGPLAGHRCIDPWIVCERMAHCCSEYLLPLGMTRTLALVPVPTPTVGSHAIPPRISQDAPPRTRATGPAFSR